MSRIKIAILDIQKSFYQGLEAVIKNDFPDLEVVGTYAGCQKMIANKPQMVDVIIMDLALDDGNGIEKIPILKQHFKDSKFIVYSAYTDFKYVKTVFQLGVDGYVSKYKEVSDLANGIGEVLEGNTYLSEGLRITPAASVFKKVFKSEHPKNYFEDKYQIKQKLTQRENEVLHLIVQAKSNREIGKELYISDQTVGVHRKNIMRKLNTKSTINLIKYAFENQLV